METWHELFVATAGSAAALTGLVFVGVSLNLTRILTFKQLPNRALLALVFLMTILLLSVALLVPHLSLFLAGVVVTALTAAVWVGVLTLDTFIVRNTEKPYRKSYVVLLLLNQAVMALYLAGGILLLLGDEIGLDLVAGGFVLGFIRGLSDSWVLLVEINR